MAGQQFIDPAVQQNLEKLLAALQGEQQRLGQILASAEEAVTQYQGMTSEAYAAQVEQARTLAVQRPVGAGSIEQTTVAIRQEAAALEQVNTLIARQVQLYAEAAAAARGTATASRIGAGAGAGAGAAGATEQSLLQRLLQQGGVPLGGPGAGGGGGRGPGQLSAEEERLLGSAQQGAAAESKLGAAIQRNILYFSQADNALQRHGALTTDFIAAAARGEVTLREFGDQVGGTIGKFAGWTGAAAAVYGAFTAVTQLARGAIDASTSVQQLHRTIDTLNDQQAGQAIIQLAHDTNSSMKDAGNAVFLFSRTFPNLNDAVYAAGLALRAFALDGVTVADQVKAQTALHQQFGLSAQALGPIYDELAAGQREFNARITDQIPALQKSASAIKNYGGDLQTFIELTTIALRTTQLSGSQVGTAFARGAANFLNPNTTKGQADRATLASLGINPNQNITSLIVDALKKSATLSPSQRQQVSQAIFGPLRGGLFAGFFTGGPSLLDQVQKQLAPGAVKGSFLEEFAKELGTSEQQLKALGNNLQQFGAELSQSGLTAPLGLLVKGLNEALTLSTGLLRVWSSLPGPVKEVAGIAAGAFAARAVTQHVGLTGVPFFGRSAEDLNRAQISSGLQSELGFYQGQYTSTARSAATAGFSTAAAERARNAEVATGTDATIIAAERRYEAALSKQVQLESEATVLQEQTVALRERINAFQVKLNEGLTAEQAAAAVGIDYRLTTLARGAPVAAPVLPVGVSSDGQAGAIAGAAALANSPATLEDLQRAAASTSFARSAAKVSSATSQVGTAALLDTGGAGALSGLGAAAKDAGAEIPQEVSRWKSAGAAVRGAAGAVPGLTTAISAGSDAVRSGGNAIGKMAGSIGSFGPLTFGLLFAFSELGNAQDQLNQAVQQFNQSVGAEQRAASFAQLTASVKQANDSLRKQKDSLEGSSIPLVGDLVHAVASVTGGTTGLENAFGAFDKYNAGQANQGEIKAYAQTFQQLLSQAVADSKNIAEGQAARERFYNQLRTLERTAKGDAGRLYSGPAVSAATDPLRVLLDSLQQLYGQTQAGFNLLPVKGGDPYAQFKSQDPKNIAKNIQALGDRLKLYGSDAGSLQELAYAYDYLANVFAGSKNDANLQLVTSAQSTFVDAVKKDAQDLIDQAGIATGAQRAALLGQAAAVVNGGKGALTAAGSALASEVARLKGAEEAALRAQAEGTAKFAASAEQGALFLAVWAGQQAALSQKAKDAAGAYNAAQKNLDATKKADQQIFSQLDQVLKSVNTAQTGASDPFELTRLRREIQQAQDAGNPVQAAQDAEQLASAEISAAKTEKDRLQGKLDLVNAENQYNQALSDRVQAYYSYREAATEDPVKQATIEIQAATAAISSAVSHGGAGTKAFFDAKAKYLQAQDKLAKGLEDRKQAYYTYKESTTRDPVTQATLGLAASTDAVNYAAKHSGVGSQAYYDAKAKQNDAKNKLFDAHLTVSEDNIQFGLDLQKISTETAINEYEHLLKLHNLTLQQRQDLLRKIDALKKGSASEFGALDLGTIRLPTPYEIRRSLLAAQSNGANAITNHNDVTIQVADERGAAAVGVVMDRYVTGTGKSIQRAKGIR